MAAARGAWREGQPGLDPDRLVFVGETWASTNMARTHGRRPVGERLVMAVPRGHRKTATFVAALRSDGMVAPTVIDGAVTGDLFGASVERRLVPALRPGDVAVTDDLACHKRAGVRAAIEAADGELRYLPAYGPDPNPIGLAFSRLKSRRRAAAKRTVAEVEEYLGEVSATFEPPECRNDFRHSGDKAATPTREPL